MDNAVKLKLFHAHTENVRALKTAWRHTNIVLNNAIRKGDTAAIQTHTRSLVLVFCAWAEASFLKLIYTPHGFDNTEVTQIQDELNSNSLEAAWEKCLELALAKVGSDPKRSNYLPNIRQRLRRIVAEYVVGPRVIRNKIAHGQWHTATNRDGDAINMEISNTIQHLDSVTIYIWYRVFQYLSDVVECLIESPTRAFHRDYWVIVSEIEVFLDRSSKWDQVSKEKRLSKKPIVKPKLVTTS